MNSPLLLHHLQITMWTNCGNIYIYIYIYEYSGFSCDSNIVKRKCLEKIYALGKPKINIVSKRKNKKFLELGPCVKQVMPVHILKMGETIVLLQVMIRKRPTRYVKSIRFQAFN